jgi:hypothetical protein
MGTNPRSARGIGVGAAVAVATGEGVLVGRGVSVGSAVGAIGVGVTVVPLSHAATPQSTMTIRRKERGRLEKNAKDMAVTYLSNRELAQGRATDILPDRATKWRATGLSIRTEARILQGRV